MNFDLTTLNVSHFVFMKMAGWSCAFSWTMLNEIVQMMGCCPYIWARWNENKKVIKVKGSSNTFPCSVVTRAAASPLDR